MRFVLHCFSNGEKLINRVLRQWRDLPFRRRDLAFGLPGDLCGKCEALVRQMGQAAPQGGPMLHFPVGSLNETCSFVFSFVKLSSAFHNGRI